jgi:probable phosphoglycerate mutase
MMGSLFDDVPNQGLGGWYSAWCDGGSRGNPGPAGFGAVIQDPQGGTAARLSQFLGVHTNNYAEYQGLLAVLEWAVANGVRRLKVISDSELMVKQMKGQYKVASPALRPLWEEAKRRARQLEGFEIRHTLRGGNAEADRLANEAMDRGSGKSKDQGPGNLPSGSGNARPEPKKAARQILDGYVKNGVVHLLEGSLPEGAFVKIIKE